MNDILVDSIAEFMKTRIENSSATRDEKEWEKSGVDCLSSVLKLMQVHPEQNMTVMGLTLEQISTLKKAAEQYSLEKVVLFPCSNGQNIVPFIRAYGGDTKSFFCYNGWSPLQAENSLEFCSVLDVLEREYGIVLYQRT